MSDAGLLGELTARYRAAVNDVTEGTPDDATLEWIDPIPFDDPHGPEFEPTLLPGALGAYVAAVAATTQTPPGMAAVMALGTLSTAARGRYDVYLPGHHWSEPVLTQTVAFAPPGERKSAVVQEITRPLIRWERAKRIETEDEAAEWQSRHRVLQKQLEAAEAAESKPKAAEDPGTLPLARRAAAAELNDHMRKAIYPLRLVADDITIERAKEMIVQQHGALAVISAEGTFFSVIAGRYSDAPALEVMLNGHAGEPITVDRRSGIPLHTPRGCLTIAVACQPHVAATMGAVDGFRDRGGAARILPAFGRSRVGTRSVNAPNIPDALRDDWQATVERILNYQPAQGTDEAGYLRPARLSLSAEAYAMFQVFRAGHEPRLLPSGDLGDLADWGSKQPGAVLRIAGLIHLATTERPDAHAITSDTIRHAIGIGNWFAEHAKVMYRVMAGQGDSAAQQVLEVIRELGSPTTRRAIRERLRGRAMFRKAGDLNEPLTVLEDHGWIRIERTRNGDTGRFTETIHLHPARNTRNVSERGVSGISGISGEGTNRNSPVPQPDSGAPAGREVRTWI